MIHQQRRLATSILIVWSLFGLASSAQDDAPLVLKGDACIQLLYADKAPAAKPLAHWRGDRKSQSQEITDHSGRDRHAQLVNLKLVAAAPPRQRSNAPSPGPDGPVYKQPVDPDRNNED